jgi:hypothetical protein
MEMKNDSRPDETVRHRFLKQVHRKTSVFLRAVFFGPDSSMRNYSLLVLLSFGLAGVLIDLDHLTITQTQMVRPLHLPYWFLVWIVCIGYYAYVHRRVHQLGVKKDRGV